MGLDTSAVQKALTSVKASFKDFAHETISNFNKGFAVAAIVESLKELAEHLKAVKREAGELGVSTSFLQTTQKISKKASGEAEDASAGLARLNVKIGEAIENGGEAEKTFTDMGIKLKDVNGNAISTEEIFKQIATAFKNNESAAGKAALGSEFFGRGWIKLAPILEKGADGLEKINSEFEKSGKIVSNENIEAITEDYNNLKLVFDRVGVTNVFATIVGGAIRARNMVMEALGEASVIDFEGKGSQQYLQNLDAANRHLAKINEERKKQAGPVLNKKEREDLEKSQKELAEEQRKMELSDVPLAQQKLAIAADELSVRTKLLSVKQGTAMETALQAKLEWNLVRAAQVENQHEQEKLAILKNEELFANDDLRWKQNSGAKQADINRAQIALLEKQNAVREMGNKIEERKNKILQNQFAAQADLDSRKKMLSETKEDRSRFTLQELQNLNPWDFSGEMRENIFKAHRVGELTAGATSDWGKSNFVWSQGQLNKADEIQRSITNLKSGEREPFKAMEDGITASAEALKQINEVVQKGIVNGK